MAKAKRIEEDLHRLHREECWRNAAVHALRAALILLDAADELQGPDWRDQQTRAEDAERLLRRSRRWTREGVRGLP